MTNSFYNKRYFIYVSAIFLLYFVVRAVTWNNTFLLEDTDSLFYLSSTEAYLSLDFDKINKLGSDSTPFYPFFSALFSLPGWSTEFGARLCSLFFSLLLFFAALGIANNIADKTSALVGLVVLSLSPFLIPLSFSVLTEPSYLAVVYAGIWLFFAQYKDPKYWKGALLAILFGAAFLNKTEGLLFLVVIPALQLSYYFFDRKKKYAFKHYLVWCLIFVSLFLLLAAPQITHVSDKMGSLALNGRQAWQALMRIDDGKPGSEKLFGLDYSDGLINIKYARTHYSEIDRNSSLSVSDIKQKVVLIATNYTRIYENILGEIIGPFGLIFFGFGLLALYAYNKKLELIIVLSFISLGLVAPLIHSSVIARQMVVIVPMIYILEGIGLVYLVNFLVGRNSRSEKYRRILLAVFVAILVLASGYTLYNTVFHPRTSNLEYSLSELEKPIRIITDISVNESIDKPIIVSRRGYISYFSGTGHAYVPFTDYSGLIKYLKLNNAHFLYLKYKRLSDYPFIERFSTNSATAEFELLYSGVDSQGGPVELYRFQRHP